EKTLGAGEATVAAPMALSQAWCVRSPVICKRPSTNKKIAARDIIKTLSLALPRAFQAPLPRTRERGVGVRGMSNSPPHPRPLSPHRRGGRGEVIPIHVPAAEHLEQPVLALRPEAA